MKPPFCIKENGHFQNGVVRVKSTIVLTVLPKQPHTRPFKKAFLNGHKAKLNLLYLLYENEYFKGLLTLTSSH